MSLVTTLQSEELKGAPLCYIMSSPTNIRFGQKPFTKGKQFNLLDHSNRQPKLNTQLFSNYLPSGTI
jgi:hypothetical protein